MRKKISFVLILVVITALAAGCRQNDPVEVYYNNELLFLYPHQGAAFGSADNSMPLYVRGEGAAFEAYLESLDTFWQRQAADGREYFYLLQNGEYYSVFTTDGQDKAGYTKYYVTRSDICFNDGNFYYKTISFPFSLRLSIPRAVIQKDSTAALDYDFLCDYYSNIPDMATVDDLNKVITVATRKDNPKATPKVTITFNGGNATFTCET